MDDRISFRNLDRRQWLGIALIFGTLVSWCTGMGIAFYVRSHDTPTHITSHSEPR